MDPLIETEPEINLMASQRNPLLISTVVQCVMDFLPFADLKNSRLVCHSWNFVAETLIRKKGIVVFSSNFRPLDYIKYFSKDHCPPVQPFTAFQYGSGRIYTVYEVYEFFLKFGKNITCLRVKSIKVSLNRNGLSKKLNLDPFIELTGAKLEEFSIFGEQCDRFGYKKTTLEISLKKLSYVKKLFLKNCFVVISGKKRIFPSKIHLENVTFFQRQEKLQTVTLTDFVNFHKCSSIGIYCKSGAEIIIDLSKDSVNAKEVFLHNNIRVINGEFSKMKTDKLILKKFPTQAIGIHSKILEIRESTLDLFKLSDTVEKIFFFLCAVVPTDNEQICLPNLKHFTLLHYPGRFVLESVPDAMALAISQLVNCNNLTEMEIGGCGNVSGLQYLDLAWLPRSLKTLKLNISLQFRYVGRTQPIEVDCLILGGIHWIKISLMEIVLERIKPKKLYVQNYVSLNDLCPRKRVTVLEFLAFIERHNEVRQIVIKVVTSELTPDERIIFSKFVDQYGPSEVTCYKFIDSYGEAITSNEFRNLTTL